MKFLQILMNSRKKTIQLYSNFFNSFIHFNQYLNSMTKMCLKFYSVIVFLLMTNSWANILGENVCDLISSDGKLSEFGVYRRFDTEGNQSFWLFTRDDTNQNETKPEYELKLSFGADWTLTVGPNSVHMFPAIHKFSVVKSDRYVYYNCTVQRHVSPLICIENTCYLYEFQILRERDIRRTVPQRIQDQRHQTNDTNPSLTIRQTLGTPCDRLYSSP